ncbi:MAG TPA: hypothetical protein VN442_21425 [Bryobacteraceae bacterium]|nr:hypothetical protein [Bryobacteraceae bacterium]
MVRFTIFGLIVFFAATLAVATAPAQDQFFAGTTTAVSDTQITVTRTVLGETTTRSFVITPETRIDGKPVVGAKVTVQFEPVEGAGDRAIHIVVRTSTPDKKKRD